MTSDKLQNWKWNGRKNNKYFILKLFLWNIKLSIIWQTNLAMSCIWILSLRHKKKLFDDENWESRNIGKAIKNIKKKKKQERKFTLSKNSATWFYAKYIWCRMGILKFFGYKFLCIRCLFFFLFFFYVSLFLYSVLKNFLHTKYYTKQHY